MSRGKRRGIDFIKASIEGDASSYDTIGFLFHKEPLSNYTPTTKNAYEYKQESIILEAEGEKREVRYSVYNYSGAFSNIAYADSYDSEINITNDNESSINEINSYVSNAKPIKYEITSKGNYNYRDGSSENFVWVGFEESSGRFPMPEYTIAEVNGVDCVIYRYRISIEALQERLKNKQSIIQKDSKGSYLYVSVVTQYLGKEMYTAGDFYKTIFNIDDVAKLERKKTLENQKEALEKNREEYSRAYIPNENAKKQILEKLDSYIKDVTGQLDTLNKQLNNMDINKVVFAPYTKGIDWGGLANAGWSAANDYDNKLYLPDDMGGKTIYVQYAKENAKGERFSLIENAPPKSYPTDDSAMREQYKSLIHGYTENAPESISYYSDIENWEVANGNPWQNMGVGKNVENVKAELIRPYEKYTFSNLSKKTFANFIRMSDEEISGKANESLSYVKEYVYVGNENESYESLWKRIQNKQLQPKEDSENGYVYERINDTKTKIVVFVYSPGSEKTVYVNFAEEDENGNLKLINKADGTVGVAPKNNLDESLPSVDFIHGYSETGTGDLNKYKFILDNPDGNGVIFNEDFVDEKIECKRDKAEYEEYKFKKLGKNNYGYFVKMGLNELKSLTGNDKYEFSHTLISADSNDATYEDLWKDGKNVNQRQVVEDPDKTGTCVLPIDNSNNVLITFVYKTEKRKKVFVNYVEELPDGMLSAFNVAPREQGRANWIYLNSYQSKSFKDANILNISPEPNLYEEYMTKIQRLANGYTALHFYYMIDDEFNAKLKELGIEEKYRYAKVKNIKSVEGNLGEDYYELLDRNIQEGEYSSDIEKYVSVSNENPMLISYIYEKPSIADIELVVKHQVKSTNRALPIADYAHELLNKSTILLNGENSIYISEDKTEAYYEIYSRDKEARISVRETTTPNSFTIPEDNQKYVFLNQYKIVGYKNGEKVELGTYSCTNDGYHVLKNIAVTQKIGELKKSYEKVEIILLYKIANSTPPSGGNEFNPCLYLSFTTNNGLSGTKDCEDGEKGSLLDESCVEDYGSTKALKITTDTGLQAQLRLPLYYIEEMNQVLSFSSKSTPLLKEITRHGKVMAYDYRDEEHCIGHRWYETEDEDGNKINIKGECIEWGSHIDLGPLDSRCKVI